MTRRAAVHRDDIVRVVRAAREAGLEVAGIRVTLPAGEIGAAVIETLPEGAPPEGAPAPAGPPDGGPPRAD